MCPILFRIGSFSLPTYGLLVATAFLVGLYLAGRLARQAGLNSEALTNLGVYAALAAIVGAKLFMVILNWRYYFDHPRQLFSISSLQAGGVFYGGLLAALAVAMWYSRRTGLPALETADVLAPAAAIGHSIGRLGCFAAGCCWGKPTAVSWSVVFTDPVAHANVGVPLGIHLHPAQLYESAGTLLIGLYLWRRFHRPHAPGLILALYLLLYSSFRFVVEFWRDSTGRNFPFDGPFTATQWVAIALLIAGAVLLTRTGRRVATPAAKQA